MTIEQFEITGMMDAHCHLREGPMLEAVVPFTARKFDIGLLMPNLTLPLTEPKQSYLYGRMVEKIAGRQFRALTTAYLTDDLSPDALEDGFNTIDDRGRRLWYAAKAYPANATTNSAKGISSVEKNYEKFERMEKIGMLLLIHGELLEHNGVEYTPQEREKAYVSYVLHDKIHRRFPGLKIVLEHVSTSFGVQYIEHDTSGNVFGTITPHHLMLTGSALNCPHAYCMPVLKTTEDRAALRRAMRHPKFFAGTDSAPHPSRAKRGIGIPEQKIAAGCFVAPGAPEAYAQVAYEEGLFESRSGIRIFEEFMSLRGPRAYGIEPAARTITFIKTPKEIGREAWIHDHSDDRVIPLFHTQLGFAPKGGFAFKARRILA